MALVLKKNKSNEWFQIGYLHQIWLNHAIVIMNEAVCEKTTFCKV